MEIFREDHPLYIEKAEKDNMREKYPMRAKRPVTV